MRRVIAATRFERQILKPAKRRSISYVSHRSCVRVITADASYRGPGRILARMHHGGLLTVSRLGGHILKSLNRPIALQICKQKGI